MTTPRPPEQIRRAAELNVQVSLTPAETLGIFAELDRLHSCLRYETEAHVAERDRLRAENTSLRYRIDEMDVAAGNVLDSPVADDGRASVRREYVDQLRAVMAKPLDATADVD